MSILGIDLGTTNSEAAVLQGGEPVVFAIDGSPLVPSVVSFAEGGRLLVGRQAVNNELLAPEDTVRWVKRKMGRDTVILAGGKSWAPAMISSAILRHLKESASAALGEELTRAVITVPAFFTERAREDTREAARLAGLEVLRLVNEPTAAAMAYARGNRRDERWLVYDLGGGTFDVSIVDCSTEVMEVRASHGDTLLGGHDFDELIASRAADAFLKEHGLDLRREPRAWARVLRAAEEAKIRLSTDMSAELREEHLCRAASGADLHLRHAVSRTEYEGMIRPLLERTLKSVRTALSEAGTTAADISRVILVGGVTRTPLVRRLLREELGVEPQVWINPDTVVAQGAAIEAAALSGGRVGVQMVDVTAHSLGMGVLDEHVMELRNLILIRRNTPLPCVATEITYKIRPDQEAVEIEIFQGESEVPALCTKVGTFRLEGLGESDSMELHHRFELDRSGLLTVTATDVESGKKVSHTVERRQTSLKADLASLESVRIERADSVGEDESPDEYAGLKPADVTEAAGDGPAEAPAGADDAGATPADGDAAALLARAEEALRRPDLPESDRRDLERLAAAVRAGEPDAPQQLADLLYFIG